MNRPPGLIGLIGAECTGKSTLARDLRELLPALACTEALRTFVDTHGRTPARDEQRMIMHAQKEAVEQVRCQTPQGIVIADPLPALTAIYSIHYFDDQSLLAEGLADAAEYDLIVWCRPDFPWQADSLHRDGEPVRIAVDELIRTHILPAATSPVVVARGSRHERAEAVRQAWQHLAEAGPT